MAFQIGVNPPGGVWQDDNFLADSRGNTVDPLGNPISYAVDSINNTVKYPLKAGYSVLARNDPDAYVAFYLVNMLCFVTSLSVIFLLMSGLPMTNRFFLWILMVTIWFSLSFVFQSYNDAVSASEPKELGVERSYSRKLSFNVWNALTLLVLIVHTIRLLLKLVKKLFRACWKMVRCCMPASSAVPHQSHAAV